MKIGLFTDCHYNKATEIGGGRRPAESYDKVKRSMEAFKEAKVDMCFCLGDMTDHVEGDTKEEIVESLKKLTGLIYSYNIPFYLIPGNHDYLMTTGEDMREACKEKLPPCVIKTDKYDFILLDANYRSSMVRFDIAGVVWTDANLPPEQIEFLKNALEKSDKECIIMVHENLDPTLDKSHIIKNSDEARKIIKESNKVKMVLHGHYHGGAENIIDGIPYITLPAMCERNEGYFRILEI